MRHGFSSPLDFVVLKGLNLNFRCEMSSGCEIRDAFMHGHEEDVFML